MIKAIETVYRGYRFRSRLEARWAVFFDSMGLKFEYEPEGFVLPSGRWYLPDFRVKTPQGKDCWYEVKPPGVTSDSLFDEFKHHSERIDEHASTTGRLKLLSGDPGTALGDFFPCPCCGFLESDFTVYDLFTCEPCNMEGIENGARYFGLFGAAMSWHKGWHELESEDDARYLRDRFAYAILAARQARFEHGARRAA